MTNRDKISQTTTPHLNEDERFMLRALQLATSGRGHASPNPMVGAVIVNKQGEIIGEGFHARCGEGHAEVNAIRSVKNRDQLRGATIYVTLEPCSHHGKTPPCAQLLIDSHIQRCVIGMQDPFPAVSGRGVAMLKSAGISVSVGVCQEECRQLNPGFLSAQERERPYIILKWAQSKDGFIDIYRETPQTPPVAFSDEANRMRVHRMRHESDAILIGAKTAFLDRPSLTCRYWGDPALRQQPLRICLDPNARVSFPFGNHLEEKEGILHINYQTSICQLLNELQKRDIRNLIVEGGRYTLQHFIDAGLWDEIHVEEAPFSLNSGISAPHIPFGLPRQHYYCGQHRITMFLPQPKTTISPPLSPKRSKNPLP